MSPSHLVTAVPLSYLLQPSRGEGLGEVMQGSGAEGSPSPAPGGLRLTKGEVITRAKGTVTCRGVCQGVSGPDLESGSATFLAMQFLKCITNLSVPQFAQL